MESTIVQVDEEDIVEILLSPDSSEIPIAGTLQLAATPLDQSRTLIVGPEVSWTSTQPSVAGVDDSGLVTGVDVGATLVVASVAGVADTSIVTVALPPLLVLEESVVIYAAEAGLSDPAPDSITVTNGGAFPLTDLAVDSVTYEQTPEDWLTAALASTAAPTWLRLTFSIASITQAGLYRATVWVSGPDATLDSPASLTVELDVAAGPAASIGIDDGEGQSAQVGADVATPPSVVVTDAFDNPVANAEVVFSVTGGGGSVAGSPDTTDANGIANVDSWTLGGMAGPNTLDATLASVGTVTFTATGVPGPATKLQVRDGDGQNAVAGSAVSTSPSVTALDALDNGVEGVVVVFSVDSGGGSITGATDTTDADGIATAGTWTLGTTAGTNTVLAVAASIPDTVTFTATGLVGGLDELVLVDGDAQVDTVAATLATQYSVRVDDVNDNGIPGITVSWQVTGGGGTIDGVTNATSDTDASGVAVATRILGQAPGTQTVRASVGGLGFVDFTATATTGVPSKLVVLLGAGQSATAGTTVMDAPAVRVTDGFDNPIQGHSVTFTRTSAGGAISPSGAQLTLADGSASLTSWTLGTMAASLSDTVEVTAAGGAVTPNPLLFVATATPDVPAGISAQSATSQTAITDTDVAEDPTVLVVDQYGNPVSDVRVNFSATTGSTPGAAADTTDANGLASTSWTVSVTGSTAGDDGTFPHQLTATVDGTAFSTPFAGAAIYSWTTHVYPILSSFGCQDCHGFGGGGAANGLVFGQSAPNLYADLVGFPSVCDPSFDRISDLAGLDSDDVYSVLVRYNDSGLTNPGTCGGHPAGLSAASLAIVKPWIRNGAPEN